MVVSGKSFLEQEQKNPVTQLTTGAKNQTVAPSDTINTSKVKAGQTTQPTGTLEKGNWTTRDKIKESITGEEAQRDILNAATTLEEGVKTVQDKILGAGNYLLKEATSFLKTGKSYEANQKATEKEVAKIEAQQEKNKVEADKILAEQTPTNQKRDDMLTVVDPYKSQPQYGPYVDYRQARLNVGSIGEAMKNVTINNDATMAYISNGLTTVSKPIINGNDYKKTLEDAYNAVTYEYAHFGNILSPELVKQYFPAWKDASDEEISRFINECAYDVEQGKRRDISMYAENFLDLSMPDGYTSKHDAILDLYGDEQYIIHGLGDFINGTATLEGKSKEDILNFVRAIKTINHYVDIVKENGANTQGASNYVIAKTFSNDYPGLPEALEIYKNFNLTTKDLATIDAQYTANMEDMKEFSEWQPFTEEDKKALIDQNIMLGNGGVDKFMNMLAALKVGAESLVPEEYQQYLDMIPFKSVIDLNLGTAFEVDGKFYDRNGNEIPRDEARVGSTRAFLNSLIGLSQSVETLKIDLDKLAETPTDADAYFERSQLPYWDLVNAGRAGVMSLTPEGIMFTAGATQIPGEVKSEQLKEFMGTEAYPTVGLIAERVLETIMGYVGEGAGFLGNVTGYTDGWDESSKEKFVSAAGGLALPLLAKMKAKLWKEAKIKISNTVIIKSWKALKDSWIKNIELIEERGEREKIAGKNEINKEIAPKEQIREQEKIVDKMVDQETTNRKSMFLKEAMQNAMSDFRKTFLEEYTKESNAEKKANGESTGPTLIDNLFKKALELGEKMKTERAAEVKAEIDNIEKGKAPEVETTTVEEKPTVEGEEVKVETTVEEPGAKVEQTKPATPEEGVTGTAKVEEKASQQTKQQIKGILRFIADVLDMGKEIKDYNLRKLTAKLEQRAERKAENQRLVDSESLSEAGLTEEQIRQMQRNPYSETLLDIINSLTKEIKNKRGKITKVKQEESMTPDEIQREVLSRGIERLQQHVNKLVEMRRILGSLYKDLQKKTNIDTSKFTESEPLKNVLKDYGYEIEVEIDPETGKQTARVYKSNRVDASPNEQAEMKYIEDFINKQLRFEKKSEADLHKDREWLKWNEDIYGKNKHKNALENSFRDAFNKFIEQQGDVKLLRAIDKGFSNLSDGIDTLKELLKKDNTVKDDAKSKILKWNEAQINELNDVIPGIKDLINLTRVAPDIVKKGVAAKRMTQYTWKKVGSVVRFVFVGGVPVLLVPSFVSALGLTAGGTAAVILGSILFKLSEDFGLKMKHKIQGTKPDLKLYETFVNNLKITDNQKALYKQKLQKQIEELTKDVQWKTEKEFNDKISEIAEILIDRTANEIAENKLRSRGTEPEEPTTPKGPDDKTPPSGGTPELTPEEKQIIKDASAIGEKEHSPAAEKAADAVEEIKQTIEDAQTDDAAAKLEERGEDVTPESIKNEIDNPKPKTLAEELGLVKEGEFENKTQEINVQEVSTELLQEVREKPEKYGVSGEEYAEIEKEMKRRTEQDAMAKMKTEDARNTNEDAANMAELNELDQKKADAKTQEEKDAIQEQIDEKKRKAIDLVQEKRKLESTAEAEEALLEQNNASYNRIEEGKDTSVGKFRQNSYSTLLFAEKYGMKAKKPLSRTSSIENIMENPNPKTKARLLEDKKRHTEEKIKKSKYAKNREKQIAELQKINEAIEENNKNLQALQEKIDTEKELTAKRSKATTREEKKELTKQIDENNKELEKLIDEQQKDLRDMPETEEVEQEYIEETGVKETKTPEIELPTPREASEKFYHASDSDFSIVDMDKTKPEGNGIGFAVNLKEDHPYTDKPYQYEIEGKDFKIGGSETLLSESVLKKICDKLGIEYNEARTMIELPELSNIIAEESGKGNKVVTKVLVEETGLDGVDTSHDYTVLWNEEKINKAFKKRETKTEDITLPKADQGEVKGEMYHVTPSDFEEFKTEDTYNDIDWNTAFGTFVTDSKPFLEDFKKVSETTRNKGLEGWKTKTLDVNAKKVILHPADIAKAFGYGKESESILIDYLKTVGRFDRDTQKNLVGLKMLDTGERYDINYDTYPWKESYTKEEILGKPGNVFGGLQQDRFEGGGEIEDQLFGDYAKQDAQKLRELGYDAVKFYEGDINGEPIYSYALFEPNKFLRKSGLKTKVEESKKTEVKEEEKPTGQQATLKEEQPLVKTDDKGKPYDIIGDPTSKEIYDRMKFIRDKAKANGNKISYRDREELEFLKEKYKTKLINEQREEYNPTEKQDLDREELGSIGGINVPTYGMSID